MRKARFCVSGAWYHVIARVNRKEFLMESACAKTMFLEIIFRAKEKYSFLLVNLVVLGNHFHLLIKPQADDSLASIMRFIMGVYAMAYNRVYQNCGRLWGGRYFSRPIASYAEFLLVFHYIEEPWGTVPILFFWHRKANSPLNQS